MMYRVQMSDNCPFTLPGPAFNKSFIRLTCYFERLAPKYNTTFKHIVINNEDDPDHETAAVMTFTKRNGERFTVTILEES